MAQCGDGGGVGRDDRCTGHGLPRWRESFECDWRRAFPHATPDFAAFAAKHEALSLDSVCIEPELEQFDDDEAEVYYAQ
jgi:hypothetical protein